MARPAPGCWSIGRLSRRAAYATWMGSSSWRARRAWWQKEWLRRYGSPPLCVVCGRPWHLADADLHHLSYAHLGQEDFSELWPTHRGCHEALHRMIEASRSVRGRSRAEASLAALALLRRVRDG
jgi:5-methylcytosine-specific restriction endonuclease McrA